MDVEQRLNIIEERNTRVEADKAWEVSIFRKFLIALVTYIVALIVLYTIGSQDFLLGALIPTLGFILSTLTLPVVKRWWINRHT